MNIKVSYSIIYIFSSIDLYRNVLLLILSRMVCFYRAEAYHVAGFSAVKTEACFSLGTVDQTARFFRSYIACLNMRGSTARAVLGSVSADLRGAQRPPAAVHR